jgi:transcriptional regulator with XRE-family HTH domain
MTDETNCNADAGRRLSEGLAGRIRSARKAARLTQAELATACGLERTSVTNIEAGKQQVHTALLIRMAEVLKVMPSDLLDGARVCCQRFDTCGQPCAPRAAHWRVQATALQAEVHSLNRYIARRVVLTDTGSDVEQAG